MRSHMKQKEKNENGKWKMEVESQVLAAKRWKLLLTLYVSCPIPSNCFPDNAFPFPPFLPKLSKIKTEPARLAKNTPAK